ncbi:MAG: tetratricopeptide repeat protein [Cyanobacteria bacterium J06626_18]
MTSSNQSVPSEQRARLEQAKSLYATGQLAFERGNYREAVTAFEAAVRLAKGMTPLGGSIQLWLMNAYSAAGRQQDAIALGETLVKHPDTDIRKQSKRVVEILKAPRLQRRADWLTPIPDLSDLESATSTLNLGKYGSSKKPAKSRARPEPQPEDLSQMNTRDNGFLWLAIAVIGLTVGGLWVFR